MKKRSVHRQKTETRKKQKRKTTEHAVQDDECQLINMTSPRGSHEMPAKTPGYLLKDLKSKLLEVKRFLIYLQEYSRIGIAQSIDAAAEALCPQVQPLYGVTRCLQYSNLDFWKQQGNKAVILHVIDDKELLSVHGEGAARAGAPNANSKLLSGSRSLRGLGTVLLLELDTLGLMLKWGPQNAEEIPQGSQGFVNLLLNCRGNVLAMDFSSTPISHISFLSKKGHIDYADQDED
ncbi:hypothetical protein Anapl_14038 [Anas platyrhynchos]|uniref:Uncharacterized protein n=1 Tax=Anas platyrhynchos TaxID=8839 RepID=R0K493_ANAPL|nr:hypothetical protein Anapl_14038 [Anas platyrhynchos]